MLASKILPGKIMGNVNCYPVPDASMKLPPWKIPKILDTEASTLRAHRTVSGFSYVG